jgi:hypothetical protein
MAHCPRLSPGREAPLPDFRILQRWACGRGGLDIATNAKRQVADAAARAEAKAVVERWNEQLGTSRDMLWSPTIRAALIAGTPWLDVFCPGCGTSRAIDLRKVDRHPLTSVATLMLGLQCSWCPESAPMPKILGLHALPRSRPRWPQSCDCPPPPEPLAAEAGIGFGPPEAPNAGIRHSPSSESFSPSSRNATLVSSTFCGEIPSAGATSTRSVSFKPAVEANFESTFV